MVKAIGISLGSVRRIWQAHKLQPHRLRTFKRSRDPSFADKLTDVVGLRRLPSGRTRGWTRGPIRRPMRWCCRSMKKARSKRSTAASPDCRSSPGAAGL
jgi:hypothetical protein